MINNIIAKAIKDSDQSYFFENYTDQASAVIEALRKSGYIIIPVKPTDDMLKAGVKSIVYGRTKSSTIVQEIYTNIIQAYNPK